MHILYRICADIMNGSHCNNFDFQYLARCEVFITIFLIHSLLYVCLMANRNYTKSVHVLDSKLTYLEYR